MNICEIEEVKEWLGIKEDDTSKDTILNIYIEGISEMIFGMIGRDILAQDYIEKYPGTDTNSLVLQHYPVNEVKSIKYVSNNTVIDILEKEEYEVNKKAGILYKDFAWWQVGGNNLMSNGICFPKRHIKVEYNAGFEKIPADLKLLFLELLQQQYNFYNSKSGKEGLKSYSISDIKLEWKSEVRLTDSQRKIIAKYKGVRV